MERGLKGGIELVIASTRSRWFHLGFLVCITDGTRPFGSFLLLGIAELLAI